jgi:hypothetical protein
MLGPLTKLLCLPPGFINPMVNPLAKLFCFLPSLT